MPILLVNIAAAMLFFAVLPLPAGYYTLLRLLTTVVFAWAAYISYARGKQSQAVILGVLVLLYNPLIIVAFKKLLWVVINLSAAVYLLSVRDSMVE